MSLDESMGRGACLFLALIEVDRFDGLKRTIGYAAAVRLLGRLSEDIAERTAGLRSVRADRVLIEMTFAAGSTELAAEHLATLADDLAGRIEIDGYGFNLAVTIGFVAMGDAALSDELVGAAERALVSARRANVPVARADTAGAPDIVDRLTLMRALQTAIREDLLDLHYQPKIDARNGHVAAVEALVRWTCPTLGAVSPAVFVPIAEETGDIRGLTEWVLDRAMRDQRAFVPLDKPPRVDINISGASLGDEAFTRGLIDRVAGAVGPIGFEITETSMIADPGRALNNLRACSAAGIGLAIDDYGSGFSSLAYLQQLPVEELKIDRSFISRLASQQRDPLLVRSTIDLAHALDMRVTAEGVESGHVLALLQVMGCDMLQGYHIARPMAAGDLADYIAGGAAQAAIQAPPSRFLRRRPEPVAAR